MHPLAGKNWRPNLKKKKKQKGLVTCNKGLMQNTYIHKYNTAIQRFLIETAKNRWKCIKP